jgi:hypothetical protein
MINKNCETREVEVGHHHCGLGLVDRVPADDLGDGGAGALGDGASERSSGPAS